MTENKLQAINYDECSLTFQVKRKHFFRDRVYTLYLLQDYIIILIINWLSNNQGQIIGFSFPYRGQYKNVYSLPQCNTKLRQLIGGRIFFGGDSFHKFYTSQGMIAEGQFGKVQKCTDGKRIFAVKTIDKAATLKQKKGIVTLVNEITIMKKIDHPNIIKLYEVFQDANNFYLVMQFVDGQNLRNEINTHKHTLSQAKICHLMRQLLSAVSYIHNLGIIHRDIKPANIMMFNDKLIVIDFGLSCFVGEQNIILPNCGTIGYMAPEIFTEEYSFKVDIFSLGCVYYKLLTGSSVFKGQSQTQLQKANKEAFVDLSMYLNKGQESKQYEILSLMLEPSPKQRISADEALILLDSQDNLKQDFYESLNKFKTNRRTSLEKEEKREAQQRRSLKKQMTNGVQSQRSRDQTPPARINMMRERDEILQSTSHVKTITSTNGKSPNIQKGQFMQKPPVGQKKVD